MVPLLLNFFSLQPFPLDFLLLLYHLLLVSFSFPLLWISYLHLLNVPVSQLSSKSFDNDTIEHWATCIWKFVQRHFIASKLNTGCGGYLDKIYKILVHILDLKADTKRLIRNDFFRSKTMKSRIGSYFFYFDKSR